MGVTVVTLYRAGRHQGRHLVGRAADVRHLSRPAGVAGHRDRAAAASVSFGDAVYLAGAAGRLNAVTTQLRLERPLQYLERPARRHVPVPVLFRVRPVAGAALSHRPLDRGEPPEPAVQRRRQDSDAVFHSVHRRHGLRVLPVRPAAAAVPACGTGAHRGARDYSAVAESYQRGFDDQPPGHLRAGGRRTTREMPRQPSARSPNITLPKSRSTRRARKRPTW